MARPGPASQLGTNTDTDTETDRDTVTETYTATNKIPNALYSQYSVLIQIVKLNADAANTGTQH